jgi:alkylation response protein AidB-like acyl-CoA dehydrogenase
MGTIEESLIFPYPKMKKEEAETLGQLRTSFASWLKGRDAEFRQWDVKGEMPDSFLNEMREFGLFSLVVPEEHGGLGFSSTAYSRTIQELVQYDASVTITAGAHSSIGMRGLLLFGTPEQKARWLPKLATGEMIAAFCLTEPGSGSDAASIKSKAVRDGDNWRLTGEKIWITNGGIASFYTVFARTDGPEGHITAFVVTRDLKGVSSGPHEDKMGLRASNTTTVNFDDVVLTKDHVLGEVGKGFKVAMQILNAGRTGLGGGSVGGMKQAIANATKQAKERKQFGKSIAEFGLIKQKVGQMVVDCYTAEAMVNMVAGIIDAKNEDYQVEAAIIKVYASECLWRTVDEALQIAAGMGYMREPPYERAIRDCRINRIFEGTNEILRLFIALSAMNDAGQELKDLSKALGNVLADPIKGFGVLGDYAKRRLPQIVPQVGGIGGMTTAAMTKAHPDLKAYADLFVEHTRQLANACDRILRKHGKDIINKQFATRRLADIMIDMFALASTISRVSQAIEDKGKEKAAKEVEILAAFCHQATRRMKATYALIDDNEDEHIKSLADHAFQAERFSWDNL